MNTYGLLGGLLIMAGLGSWAVWERGDAARWQEKFVSLQSSYAQTAQKAKDDATKQEQADLANLKSQSSQAISQALQGQKTAETALQSYLARGNAASRGKDLGHQCFSVPIPADEIP